MKHWKILVAALGLSAMTPMMPMTAFADAQKSLVVGQAGVPRHFNGAIQSGIYTFMPSSSIFASPLRYSKSWEP